MSEYQNSLTSFVSCASQMNGPFRVQASGTGFLYKNASGVGQLHRSSVVPVNVFQFRKLFAQCGLRDV